MDIDNPYQSPASGHHSPLDLPLASLGLRLAGAMLDGLVSILAMVPAMVVMLLSTFMLTGDFDPNALDAEPLAQMAVGLTFLGCLVLMAGVQWYLISTRGQSLGKIAVKTRIVRTDGSAVDFVSGVLLRNWVLSMVQGVLGTFCLGWVIPLADGLAIFFGDRRQCLHDHIASTVVVDARYRPGEEIGQIFS